MTEDPRDRSGNSSMEDDCGMGRRKGAYRVVNGEKPLYVVPGPEERMKKSHNCSLDRAGWDEEVMRPQVLTC